MAVVKHIAVCETLPIHSIRKHFPPPWREYPWPFIRGTFCDDIVA